MDNPIDNSKNIFSQTCTIYGYDVNDFAWDKSKMDSTPWGQTHGLIVQYNSNTYILSSRSIFLKCKSIVMYHCRYGKYGKVSVYRQPLQILFQMAEYDIIILGSIGMKSFDVSKSEIMSGVKTQEIVDPYLMTDRQASIKDDNYHMMMIYLEINPKNVKYDFNMYQLSYKTSTILDQSFVSVFVHTFEIIKSTVHDAIWGSIIYNRQHEMVGMVTGIENDHSVFVLPYRTIYTTIENFVQNIDQVDQYSGLLNIPLRLAIVDSQIVSTAQVTLRTTNGNKNIKKNDQIMTINKQKVEIQKDQILIRDEQLCSYVPLTVFFNQNLKKKQPMNIAICRNKKNISLDAYGRKMKDTILPITDVPYYFPTGTIPYVNLNGLIMVQLTHELLGIVLMNNIKYTNMIDTQYSQKVIILDCLDKRINKKTSIKFSSMTRMTEFYTVATVNGIECPTLRNVIDAIAKCETHKIKIYSKNKKMIDICI